MCAMLLDTTVAKIRLGHSGWTATRHQFWFSIVGALLLLSGCDRSSPVAPSALIGSSNRPSNTSGSTFRSFGSVQPAAMGTGDAFARCLQGSAETSCFSAARVHRFLPADATSIQAPLNLTATATGTSVNLTWVPPSQGMW
jgi:hypothetical protein